MVTFTQIPDNYTPTAAEARYAFALEQAGTVDVRITDAADGSLVAAKRFVEVAEAAFDAAPALRRATKVVPGTGGTGVGQAAGRQIMVNVQVFEANGTQPLGAAPTRIFLAAKTPVTPPALLTTMPRERLIARGECDELLLLFEKAGSVTVTAQNRDSLTAQSYPVTTAGLRLFRLDTRDFPEAETLTVDAGPCGTVVYTLIPARHGAVRLAWRSSEGSVEHYTFPVVRTETVAATRRQAYGPEGYLSAGEETRQQLLVSAYEPRAVLDALAELLTTPDVWIAGDEGYTPVDVVTDRTVIRRHGTMCCFEAEIRPKRKTLLPWN